jgi:hypothetical protein
MQLKWAEHVRKLGYEHAFDRTYRGMSVRAFYRLLDLLRDGFVSMSEAQHGGYHDTDTVEPELIMQLAFDGLLEEVMSILDM